MCHLCEKSYSGKPERISFEHRGMTFSVFKSGSEHPECVKKETIRKFGELGKEFISKKEKIEVDWNFYFSFVTGRGRYSEERKNRLNGMLENINILSYSPRNNWQITDGFSNFNPTSFGGHLYFTREEDAREYAAREYGGTLYGWWIQHIDKVISRKELGNQG